MKWLEAFMEWLDKLYYEGYAIQLSKNDPDAFAWEYDRFIQIH